MSDDTKALLCFSLVLILAFGACFCFGFVAGESYTKRDAIKNRHAEYKVDENGNPVWQWKAAK